MCTKEHHEMVLGHQAAVARSKLAQPVPVMKWQQFQSRLKEEVVVLLGLGRKLVQDVWTDLTARFPLARRVLHILT